MKTFESKIDLFDNVYGAAETAEITTCYRLDNGDNGSVGVYFTVTHPDDEDYVEIYDMKKGRRFIVIDSDFVSVCTLLGLSLDPMALDPISITNEWIDPVDGDVFGSYFVTMENGKWIDYDLEDFDKFEKYVEESLEEVWAHYCEEPEMFTVYNG